MSEWSASTDLQVLPRDHHPVGLVCLVAPELKVLGGEIFHHADDGTRCSAVDVLKEKGSEGGREEEGEDKGERERERI